MRITNSLALLLFLVIVGGVILMGARPVWAASSFVVNVTTDAADTNVADGVCDSDAAVGSQCSLRAAIQSANNNADLTTITFDAVVFSTAQTITITSEIIVTTGSIIIDGPGAQLLTISGGTTTRPIRIPVGITAQIEGITFANGSSFFGGGLNNDGTLTVTDSAFVNNVGSIAGGAIHNGVNGTLTVKGSTFSSNNNAPEGGAIDNLGTLIVYNSTFSGNSASTRGGAIDSDVSLTLVNSTLVDNQATGSGTIGGVRAIGTNTIGNTIIADSSGANCSFSGTVTRSNNLATDATCGTGFTQVMSTQLALGVLANNGGATQTFALLPNSVALNAGDNTAATNAGLTTDQRGVARIADSTIDIGAFELECGTTPFDIAAGDSQGLINAITCANGDGVDSVINLSNSTYTLTTANNYTGGYGGNGLPAIANNGTLTINGDGATINGSGAPLTNEPSPTIFRLLFIQVDANLTLNSLTLSKGQGSFGGGFLSLSGSSVTLNNSTLSENSASNNGGGFYSNGSITINNITASENSASNNGGGFYMNGSSLVVNNSNFSNNTAKIGGGFIILNSMVGINNSTISNNAATIGGGFYSDSDNHFIHLNNSTIANNSASNNGGGFYNNGKISINNSTVANNSASNNGGGFYSGGGGIVTLSNSTVSGNSATGAGGGFYNESTSTVIVNNTIAANSTNGECDNAGTVDGSFNLIETPCTGVNPEVLSNTLYNVDPGLDPAGLQDNGGTTQTIALLPNSPAIDAGSNALSSSLITDQRGQPRFYDDTGMFDIGSGIAPMVDLGAYERQVNSITPVMGITDVSVSEGSGGTTNLVFTVLMSNTTGRIVTVDYASSDGSAQAGSDYTAVNGTLSFAPLETSKQITVSINSDTTFETDETFSVILSNATNVSVDKPEGISTITNDDTQPSASINNAALPEGSSGNTTFNFVVSLSNPSYQAITLGAFTENGGAIADSDYNALPPVTLTFAPGETSKQITVNVNGDTTYEYSEAFLVYLVKPTNTTVAGLPGIGFITNDDAQPSIAIDDVTLGEGSSGTTAFTFTVALSNPSFETITVNYATDNGTAAAPGDYAALASNTLTFAPGETSKTVTVNVNGDTTVEANETFFVNLGGATNAAIADSQGVGTITDDEGQASIIISPTSGLVTTEAGGTANFTVKLSKQPTASVVIALSTSDTTEGLVPASVGLNTLNWNTGVTVTVTGQNDTLVDGNIAYTIITGAVTSSDPSFSAIQPSGIADVSVTNTDDEGSPGVIIMPTNGLVTTESGGTATFNVRLATQPSANVTVALSSSDTTEGTVPSGVTITTVNWSTGVNVTVTGKDDVLLDGNIAYSIITGAVTSADPHYSSISPATIDDVSVTNTDNDGAGFEITPTSGVVTTEAGGTATFNIRLTSRPSANVTIAFSISDTTEGTVRTNLTFTPDTWNLARTVIVTGVNDALVDGNIAYSIITGAVTSADPMYAALDPALIPDISLTNHDDDGSASPAPAVASISPVGVLSQTPATFNWVGNASSYRLNILQEVSVEGELQTFALLKNSYEASVVCTNGLCSAQPELPLTPGVSYTWIVEAVGVDNQVIGSAALSFTMPSVMVAPAQPELPELPPTDAGLLPPVTLVSPVRETSENPVAFIWISATDAVEYRLLVQNQADRSSVADVIVSGASCNGNVCVSIPTFVPQNGLSYVWTVTPITASGAGIPSAEAGFTYSPAAPGDDIELPGAIIGG